MVQQECSLFSALHHFFRTYYVKNHVGGPSHITLAIQILFLQHADSPSTSSPDYASNVARSAGSSAKKGTLEVMIYVKENPTSLRVALFVAALLLAFFSLLGIINVFNIFKPGQ